MAAQIICGDSRDILRGVPDCSLDGCVTDPPYALTAIVQRFGSPNAAPARVNGSGAYARASAGFMGQAWDTGETAFDPEFWREVWRVLKPGAHLAAFGGTRTYHRLACAVEDAGFEIRDQLAWVYGSGFPKSHRQHGAFDGWGTALKPAHEPIVLARKPLDGSVAENLSRWGVGALNIDGCRVDGVATGRWPANFIHDGSGEVAEAFPVAPGQRGRIRGDEPARLTKNVYGAFTGSRRRPTTPRSDSGSAIRFFYAAKASSAERAGSKHPTVKPIALIRWLCRLIAPPGAVILDPFAGSGTTGEAAMLEGQRSILIEREPRYCSDIGRRMARAAA